MTLPGNGPVHDDEGEVLDQIRLVGLRATGHHGVFEHERVHGQEFVADVVVHLDTRAAAVGDALARTVHYGELAERVTAVLSSSPADLIETVAERIAAVVLAEPAAVAVDVTLHKPQAPITVPFDDVAVAVRRSRTRPPVVPVPLEPFAAAVPEVPAAPEAALPPAIPPGDVAVAAAGVAPDATSESIVIVPPVALPDVPVPDAHPLAAGAFAAAPFEPTTAEAEPAGAGEQDEPEPGPDDEDHADLTVALRDHDRMDEIPASPVDVVLALGSNVGDPQQTLRDAISALDAIGGIEVVDVSPLARTAPVGGVEQDDFLNAVVVARTAMSARELLHACQDIEHSFGRVREERWGPRTLDVDIVVYGTLTDVAEDLELPHPRAHERAFVLEPWSQVQPDAVLPGLGGGPVAQLAATAPDRAGIRWLALDWLGDHERDHAQAPAPEQHPESTVATGTGPAPVAPERLAPFPEPAPPAPAAPASAGAPVGLPDAGPAPLAGNPAPAHPGTGAQPVEQHGSPAGAPAPVVPPQSAPPAESFDALLSGATPGQASPADAPPLPLVPARPTDDQRTDDRPAPDGPAAFAVGGPAPAEPEGVADPLAPSAPTVAPTATPPAELPDPSRDDTGHRTGDGPSDAATAAFDDVLAPSPERDRFPLGGDTLVRPAGDPFVAPSADPFTGPSGTGTSTFPSSHAEVGQPEAARFARTSTGVVGRVVPPTSVPAPGPARGGQQPTVSGDLWPPAPGAGEPATVAPAPAPGLPSRPQAAVPPSSTAPLPSSAHEPAGGLLTGVPLSFPPVSGGTRAVEPAHPPVEAPRQQGAAPAHGGAPATPPEPGPLASAPLQLRAPELGAPADAARPAAPLFPPTTEEPPTR
ncbi:2-amino-4-hydroxy-6-hydroxymethyldihydropteridine diphosphokinase [Luteimicrobium sp. DT211]|uniref:2-amino-4-hydroxy-6- hydroxymethyldihydropteridine diphosphokinase n=1 Tax=Luteimicrobium sp. DT211 TaxID=3393412 RepID=UPI003CF109F1